MSPHDSRPVLKGRIGLGVRSAFSFFYPSYVGENDLLIECIGRYLNKDSLVLDAGCGSGAFFPYAWRNHVRLLVGCDISEHVRGNPNLTSGVRADLAHVPFASETFDVVFSRYVLEHLDAPGIVFAEIARVLKPGGKLIVLTPSKYHYVVLLSRIMPHWVHERISTVRGNSPEDTFPTRYFANSKAELTCCAKEAGLTLKEFLTREMSPNYLLWSLPSFLLGVAYERLVNRFKVMRPFRVCIIAVFERRCANEKTTL